MFAPQFLFNESHTLQRGMPAPAVSVFLFQAEDGIRDLVRSRGLGDVYKRQGFGDQAGHLDLSGRPRFVTGRRVSGWDGE